MKVLISLLITALMTSSVVTERLHIENNGKKHVYFLGILTEPLAILFEVDPFPEKGEKKISE